MEYDLYRGREAGAVANRCYCEINVYVTRAPRPGHGAPAAMRSPPPRDEPGALPRVFTARQLFDELLSPAVSSKDQAAAMAAGGAAPNRFQDTWVWNGRPQWDAIFEGVRAGRRHKDIGVCFCGTPVIGADLDRMCKKHSSTHDDCIFTLHKENF